MKYKVPIMRLHEAKVVDVELARYICRYIYRYIHIGDSSPTIRKANVDSRDTPFTETSIRGAEALTEVRTGASENRPAHTTTISPRLWEVSLCSARKKSDNLSFPHPPHIRQFDCTGEHHIHQVSPPR